MRYVWKRNVMHHALVENIEIALDISYKGHFRKKMDWWWGGWRACGEVMFQIRTVNIHKEREIIRNNLIYTRLMKCDYSMDSGHFNFIRNPKIIMQADKRCRFIGQINECKGSPKLIWRDDKIALESIENSSSGPTLRIVITTVVNRPNPSILPLNYGEQSNALRDQQWRWSHRALHGLADHHRSISRNFTSRWRMKLEHAVVLTLVARTKKSGNFEKGTLSFNKM